MIGLVVVGVGTDRVDEHLGGEDVVAHRDEGLLGIVGSARRVGRLLDEAANAAGLVGVDAAERGRLGTRYPDAGHRCTGAAVDVELHHLLGIHPVHVVSAEHHDVVGILVVDQVQRLIDRVGRAGVPARSESLLRRNRGDVLPRQTAQPPVLRDVPVQRMRLVLGQHADAQIPGIDQVRQHEVDQPIGAAEGNRGLGAVRGERIQPFALAPGHDDAEYVWQLPHGSKPSHRGCRRLSNHGFAHRRERWAGSCGSVQSRGTVALRSAVCEWR